MQTVKKGDTIKVHYTGKLPSGEIFDSSEGREPLEFTVGAGMMILGFDKGVEGMTLKEFKTLKIIAEEAYGVRNEDHVFAFAKENIPPDITPQIGDQFTLQDQGGNPFPVTVVGINENDIMMDANHFLAGKDLVFDITLVDIA